MNSKTKIKFLINKKFIEMTDEEYKIMSDNKSHLSSKEEDFKWADEETDESNKLKQLYLQYPFKTWRKIINIDFSNKYNVCKIFKEDVFNEEKFLEEDTNSNIIKKYTIMKGVLPAL